MPERPDVTRSKPEHSVEWQAAEAALRRLRQLAKEERAAVENADSEVLCHIAAMLPHAAERLAETLREESLRTAFLRREEWTVAFTEIQSAHASAERYLDAQLTAVSSSLKQCALARRLVTKQAHQIADTRSRLNDQR